MVVVFPAPLTPATRIAWGRADGCPGSEPGTGRDLLELAAQLVKQLSGLPLRRQTPTQGIDDFGRRFDADVRLDQDRLDLFQGLFVDRPRNRGGDAVDEQGSRSGKTASKAVAQARQIALFEVGKTEFRRSPGTGETPVRGAGSPGAGKRTTR